MKKIAILIEDHYETLEAWYPYLRLKEAGYMPVFMGTGRKKEYKSKEGYPAQEEISAKDANYEEFLGLIVVGGYAPDYVRRSEEAVSFVKEMYEKDRMVAAICHGGWVLASAGILTNKRATGFWSIQDDMKNAGAEYVDEEVVVDGNLITSRSPEDLPRFCQEIIQYLEGVEDKDKEARMSVGALGS